MILDHTRWRVIFGRAEQEPEPVRPKRMLVYGDSLSWG